jgi:hypothetical protein
MAGNALGRARDVSTAKGPSEAAVLWSSQFRQQFETLSEQSKELTPWFRASPRRAPRRLRVASVGRWKRST